MNKKPADIDPRSIAVDFFRKLGGMEGMTKWGKTHRSLAYGLIAKLLAQPTVQTNVNVAVINEEVARAKLQDALLRQIEARRFDSVDPVVTVNGERIIDGVSYTPASADPAPSTDATRPATPDPRSATADPRREPPDSPPRPVQSFVPGQGAGAALDGSDDNRSTTQKYLDWSGHGKLF
jgi:hypothetical protein